MGGRFGKYGDLKRKAALRRSRIEKTRLQAERPAPRRRRRKKRPGPPQAPPPDAGRPEGD